MKFFLLIVYSYLLGSIPFGVVVARMKGVDLRKVGSGNIGATNVMRALGKKSALMTLLGDLLKGTVAVATAKLFAPGAITEGAAGLAAIAGHNFSAFLRLRGGKGVATSLGVILIYMPQAGFLTAVIWLITVFVTRYSSMGALVSFTLLPVISYFYRYPEEKTAFAVVISVMLIVRHASNIKRLIKGTEGKIGEKA